MLPGYSWFGCRLVEAHDRAVTSSNVCERTYPEGGKVARATARAAAVTLGSVESIATQPPAFCNGQSGPMRVVQVTINYTIK